MSTLRTVLVVAEKREVLAAIRTLLLEAPGAKPYGPYGVVLPRARYRLVHGSDGVRMLVGLSAHVAYVLGEVPPDMDREVRIRLLRERGTPHRTIDALLDEMADSAERSAAPWDKEWRSFEDNPTITWTRTDPPPGNWSAPAVSVSDLEDALRSLNLGWPASGGVWGVDWGGATPRLGRFGHQRFVEFVWANDEPETCPDIESSCTEG